jgi:hypothetical protein
VWIDYKWETDGPSLSAGFEAAAAS